MFNTDVVNRKNFYVEAKEIKAMTEEEVAAYRKDNLDGVKIRYDYFPSLSTNSLLIIIFAGGRIVLVRYRSGRNVASV